MGKNGGGEGYSTRGEVEGASPKVAYSKGGKMHMQNEKTGWGSKPKSTGEKVTKKSNCPCGGGVL